MTLHSDVCASTNHLRTLVTTGKGSDPAVQQLVADIEVMLAKLDARQEEYETCRATIGTLHSRMAGIAFSRAVEKELVLMRGYPKGVKDVAFLAAAEVVRKSAWVQEVHCLRPLKDVCLRMYSSLMEVKGQRAWLLEEADGIEAKWQAWLPAEPHRTLLLVMIREAAAHVSKDSKPGEEPIVQFEDGGRIPMSQIVITSRGSLGRRI